MGWLDIFGGDDTGKKNTGSEKGTTSPVEKNKDTQKKKEEIEKELEKELQKQANIKKQANIQKHRELNKAINEVYKGTKKIEIKSIKEIDQLNPEEKRELIKAIKGKRNEIIQELSFEEKKTVIEKISNNSGLSPDDKLQLADLVLSLTEKQQWIRDLLKDKNLSKENRKSKIEGFFKVYELVNSMPPYQRQNESTRNLFAKKAGIVDYKELREQNEKIREWILKVMLEIGDLYTSGADVLDKNHDNRLKEIIVTSDKQLAIGDALSALSIGQREKINMLTKEQFQDFINELNNIGSKNAQKLEEKFGVEKDAQNIFGLNLEMSVIQKKLDNIKIQFESAGGNPAITDQDRKIYCDKFQMSYPKTAKETLAIDVGILEEKINQSDIDPIKKEELIKQVNTVKTDIYTTYSKYNRTEELKQIRGPTYYAKVEQRYFQQQTQVAEKYQEGKTGKDLRKIGKKLSRQKEFTDFFDKNKIEHDDLQGSFSQEEYENILLKEKGDIKDEDKDKIQQQQEKDLLDTANTKIKDRFVERVTYFLGSVLDIQMDKDGKENILKGLDIDEKNIDKNVITIQGKYQNKKLTFIYNIQTGDLFTGKWLHGAKNNPQISIGQKMEKLNTVSGPTFGEHFKQAKTISYTDAIQKSEGNISTFEKNINNQLIIKCPLPEQSDAFREEMKLNNLKNIAAQEIFEMMGLENRQWPVSGIDGSQYHIFPLLARSLDTYTKDQLLQIRSIIQGMNDFYRNQKQVDNITTEKASIDPKLNELEKDTKDNRYKPLKNITKKLFLLREKEHINSTYMGEQFASFFDSLLSDRPESSDGQKIIDPEKLYTYYEDLQQTENKSINKEYFANLQENMSQYFAETDLDKNLQIA
ncbi:hypothetical protein P148_SR1C00001G0015 [candidate division SR1 bacterium RAAC1_SR1_1]|nr:hypothetical protein P148_SR1C00001G0015 [candidate division SR1 bacterium RAAC1_SR1_1]